ncbi:MAG: nucleotidyltransferase domain-containing protein [Sphingobacteriaceae bacterium]|nr:nucleotidyltransferase domain-containing protein [Sphingobacteriaceae bacterium]
MNDARFGLKNGDLAIIVNILRQYPEIETAIIFGSRAKGNYKNGSDIDIALKGNISFRNIADCKFMLDEETILPYMFDVLDYNTLKNEELKQHIDRVGVVFYER